MAVNIEQADNYFETRVLNNDEWVNAEATKKQRALNQASDILYRVYRHTHDENRNPVPGEAIFEQALWLLRVDDMVRRSEQGVTSFMVDGIQVAIARIDRTIAPAVLIMLGRKVGRSSGARNGYIVRG